MPSCSPSSGRADLPQSLQKAIKQAESLLSDLYRQSSAHERSGEAVGHAVTALTREQQNLRGTLARDLRLFQDTLTGELQAQLDSYRFALTQQVGLPRCKAGRD